MLIMALPPKRGLIGAAKYPSVLLLLIKVESDPGVFLSIEFG